jgi:hypothetical protein
VSGWTYHQPIAGDPHPEIEPDVETVGRRELELMLLARASSEHTIVMTHDRASNADRMAARRLVARKLLTAPNAMRFGTGGWLYFYALTERGRTCWLRTKASA